MKKIIPFLSLLVVSVTISAAPKLGSIPQCVSAWNKLGEAQQLENVKTLVGNNCQIIYTKGWLNGVGVKSGVCPGAWNGLNEAGMLDETKELVQRNCAIMYKQGWVDM